MTYNLSMEQMPFSSYLKLRGFLRFFKIFYVYEYFACMHIYVHMNAWCYWFPELGLQIVMSSSVGAGN